MKKRKEQEKAEKEEKEEEMEDKSALLLPKFALSSVCTVP